MSKRERGSSGRAIVAFVTLFAATGAGSEPLPLARRDAAAIDLARAGAVHRLQAEECQKVLTDFVDARGRPLREDLEKRRLSVADYLRTIAFVDGSSNPVCRTSKVLLITAVGARSVGVCPSDRYSGVSRFSQIQRQNPSFAEFTVIHEMLHTLGLGENPPSSAEITARVESRCR